MLDKAGLTFRSAVLRAIRNYFYAQGFIEVDTPIRQPLVLPEASITPVRSESWFLQTSPEQFMKRLLARGCAPIFQICRCFRAQERGRRHLEEFAMLEWYRIDSDYLELMNDCTGLIRHVVEELDCGRHTGAVPDRCRLGRASIDGRWQRISVEEAFAEWSPLGLEAALAADRFDEMIVEHIEPRLGSGRPAFLYDYPAACSALAKLKDDDPGRAERFELYIDGMELANGFSELTDPLEQRARFLAEQQRQAAAGRIPPPLPERFLEELGAIGRAAGIAFGIDRFLMVLLQATSIAEVVPFAPDELA